MHYFPCLKEESHVVRDLTSMLAWLQAVFPTLTAEYLLKFPNTAVPHKAVGGSQGCMEPTASEKIKTSLPPIFQNYILHAKKYSKYILVLLAKTQLAHILV